MSYKSQPTFVRHAKDSDAAAISENVAVTGTSAASAAMPVGVGMVRVLLSGSTDAAYMRIGKTPTATTNDMALGEGIPEYFAINEGEKVAVIGTDGSVNITPMSK